MKKVQFENLIFQHDDAPVHKAKTIFFKKEREVVKSPANSPDQRIQ